MKRPFRLAVNNLTKARSIDRLGTHPKGGDSASNYNNCKVLHA